jgi:hypothetical protein
VRILDGVAGTAARTRVLIESTDGKHEWGTVGVSENIIEASLQALVDSMEYALLKEIGVQHSTFNAQPSIDVWWTRWCSMLSVECFSFDYA